jgi:hypothetical protein
MPRQSSQRRIPHVGFRWRPKPRDRYSLTLHYVDHDQRLYSALSERSVEQIVLRGLRDDQHNLLLEGLEIDVAMRSSAWWLLASPLMVLMTITIIGSVLAVIYLVIYVIFRVL